MPSPDYIQFRRFAIVVIAALLMPSAAVAEPLWATGSGIYINAKGEILTNAHVVTDCTSLAVRQGPLRSWDATVVVTDSKNDLAVLRTKRNQTPTPYLAFRQDAISPGQVVAMGYPLSDVLQNAAATLTVGNINATTGTGDDPAYLQMSAPVQPGNSGGPLLDADGHIAGIVAARYVAENAQNVNFAIKAEVAIAFLTGRGIEHTVMKSTRELTAAEIGNAARPSVVLVECYSTKGVQPPAAQASAPPALAPPALPAPARPQLLPDCTSSAVVSTLFDIGSRMRVTVYNIYPVTVTAGSDINFCRAMVWTSAGKRAITYTVTWTDRYAGRYWVQLTGYSRPLW